MLPTPRHVRSALAASLHGDQLSPQEYCFRRGLHVDVNSAASLVEAIAFVLETMPRPSSEESLARLRAECERLESELATAHDRLQRAQSLLLDAQNGVQVADTKIAARILLTSTQQKIERALAEENQTTRGRATRQAGFHPYASR